MNDVDMGDVVARAKSGSPEAAGILYTLYSQRVYRFLFFRTGDAQIAEDLTGEVFLKMVQALPDYQQGGTPFQAWLYQIARNLVIDYFRHVHSHPVVQIDEEIDWEVVDLDGMIDFHFSCEELARGMAILDENYRDVLLLRFIEGLTIAQTAQSLHKTIDAVKALQRRGLMALRHTLQYGGAGHG